MQVAPCGTEMIASALVALCLLAAAAATSLADEPSPMPAAERTKLIADWEALKYGMFIHFGMSTFTGDEFGGVPAKSSAYNPTHLDVDQWIRTAKNAGMKYAVLTTKHCYGHALWPTKASSYSVATGPVKVDVVRRFVDACRKYKLKPGFYYLLGWDTMQQRKMTPPEYEAFCRAQVAELLTNYGPITEIWFDIPWDMGPETDRVLADLYALVKRLQPDSLVLLNQGFFDGSKVVVRERTYRGQPVEPKTVVLWPKDIIDGEITPPPSTGHVPKMKFGGKTYYLPMETCDTVARHWFAVEGDALNTLPTLCQLYKSTVGRGANLLLDAGPDKTGRIPAGVAARLMELKRTIDNPATAPINLLAGKKATASNVYKNDHEFSADKLTDGDSRTRWATDNDQKSAWVEFDLGKATTFDSAVATEGWNRIEEFAIEIRDGHGGWKAIYTGGKIGGDGRLIRFPPVTAARVRLNILRATAGPTIWDFEIYDSKMSTVSIVQAVDSATKELMKRGNRVEDWQMYVVSANFGNKWLIRFMPHAKLRGPGGGYRVEIDKHSGAMCFEGTD
jgi:alpha-L-fucosidase